MFAEDSLRYMNPNLSYHESNPGATPAEVLCRDLADALVRSPPRMRWSQQISSSHQDMQDTAHQLVKRMVTRAAWKGDCRDMQNSLVFLEKLDVCP